MISKYGKICSALSGHFNGNNRNFIGKLTLPQWAFRCRACTYYICPFINQNTVTYIECSSMSLLIICALFFVICSGYCNTYIHHRNNFTDFRFSAKLFSRTPAFRAYRPPIWRDGRGSTLYFQFFYEKSTYETLMSCMEDHPKGYG